MNLRHWTIMILSEGIFSLVTYSSSCSVLGQQNSTSAQGRKKARKHECWSAPSSGCTVAPSNMQQQVRLAALGLVHPCENLAVVRATGLGRLGLRPSVGPRITTGTATETTAEHGSVTKAWKVQIRSTTMRGARGRSGQNDATELHSKG